MLVQSLEKSIWGQTIGTSYGKFDLSKEGTFEMPDEQAQELIDSSPNFVDAVAYANNSGEKAVKDKKQLLKGELEKASAETVLSVAESILPDDIFKKNKTKSKKILSTLVLAKIKEQEIDVVLETLKENDTEE